jgi:MraZ protein
MDQFVSTFRNRVDGKGRVSIPAPFRAVLAREGFAGVFCYPSLDNDALEAGGQGLVDFIHGLIEALDPYSDERHQLATVLLGEGQVLNIDQDGRVVLPDSLREHAGIGDEAIFVGVGDKFFLWSPERYEAYRQEARRNAKELKRLLVSRRRNDDAKAGARE